MAITFDHLHRRRGDQAVTWWDKLRQGYQNAFYRNSIVYCMVILTINMVLNLIPLTKDHCGF